MKAIILLIDDDPVDIKALQALLESWNFETILARSGAEGLATLARVPVDLVLSDVRMPEVSGEQVVKAVAEAAPGLPVILITGYGDIRSAVQAMKLGAYDYVVKPPDEDEFRLVLERALEHARLRRDNAFFRAALSAGGMYGERLVGRDPRTLAMFELINRVAASDSTVLITGETGTGKELVAQTLHYQSMRRDRPFVAVNCAALHANLIESELFGHEKGAFTGASAARRGRFEDADGGSLFLDEIGETSLEFQAKLLRVLQEQSFERVGGNRTIRVDVRVMASTNRDLDKEVAERRFREDLYYRLRVIPIHVPPLRERIGDLEPLAHHFLRVYRERYHTGPLDISPAAMDDLRRRTWSGNVRELQHAIERAVVLADGGELGPDAFREPESFAASPSESGTLRDHVDRRSREHVLAALERSGWRKQKAAEDLGIDRATLYRLLQRYRITRP